MPYEAGANTHITMQRYLLPLLVAGFSSAAHGFPSLLPGALPSLLPVSEHGWNPNAGWAPARMNDITYSSTTVGYAYPEPKTPVRLFLIDSAVHTSSGWFAGNPNLTFAAYFATYPSTSPSYDHATKMLSVIAGHQAGIAPGTPIEVVNYNISNGGATPNLSDLGSAIYNAVNYQSNHPGMPAVICCAQGSEVVGQSYLVNGAIDSAINSGITVIFSAGNKGSSASNYSPSSNGTKAGAICVGASTTSNTRLTSSNYGTPVDFFCPGQNVRVLNPANISAGQTALMNGTSPATAITAGAAIMELSANPTLKPAELESLLRSRVASGAVSILQIPVPEDIDNDGSPNVVEAFFGSDWSSAASLPPALKLTRSGTTSTLSFSVPVGMLSSTDSSKLAAGGFWRPMRRQADDSWAPATVGEISVGAASNGKVPVQVSLFDEASFASYCLEIEFTN